MSARPDIELAVRAALHYLDRASDSWQNGNAREAGPLHWPIAVAEARRALDAAVQALAEERQHGAAPPELRCTHCGGTSFAKTIRTELGL